jgi:actin-like ATPase involved in cell morphogenesis
MGEKKQGRRREQKATASTTPKVRGMVIGLDLGYGFTKIVREDGQRLMFPSVVAAIAPTMMTQLNPVQEADEVLVDRIRYIVGERAIGHTERFSNLHTMWWTMPSYRALIAQAKKFIPDQACVVTGLPYERYMAQQGHSHVADAIKAGLRAQHVTVIPQGVGAYFSDPSLEHPRNKVALVDIGTWTTELVAMTGHDLISQGSTGLRLGINDIFATVAAELQSKVDRVVDPYEVERAYRGEEELRTQGRAVAQELITDRVAQLAKEQANQLLAKMTDLWGPHAAAYESVIFCGGGARLLFPFLKGFREGATLVTDAQFANARGYLNVGLRIYGPPPAMPADDQEPAELVATAPVTV